MSKGSQQLRLTIKETGVSYCIEPWKEQKPEKLKVLQQLCGRMSLKGVQYNPLTVVGGWVAVEGIVQYLAFLLQLSLTEYHAEVERSLHLKTLI